MSDIKLFQNQGGILVDLEITLTPHSDLERAKPLIERFYEVCI